MSDDDATATFPGSTWRAAAFREPEQSLLVTLEAVYKDIHSHPELSMQEHRTAGIAADWLENLGYAVTRGVGGTGVVGVLANGDGATVLLRADMDALPMKETTGLSYASVATGVDESGSPSFVAHSCGHDMHVTWLLGATQVLAANRDRWHGTVIAVFQPAEETGEGAEAMLADDLIARFPRPDVALGQHVVPAPAGSVAWTSGTTMSASDSLEVRLHGRGAHGSSPEHSVDPIVMAAATVMNLQAVRSREIGMQEAAVLTVGSLHAGNSDNVIPDEAVLRLNVRSFDEGVRQRVLAGIQRVVNAAAAAANAPARRKSSPWALTRSPATTRLPPHAWSGHSCRNWVRMRYERCRPPPRAKTSARSAPLGESRRCSGSSAAPTRRSLRRPPGPAPSPNSPRTTIQPSRPSSTPPSRPGSRRWSSLPRPGSRCHRVGTPSRTRLLLRPGPQPNAGCAGSE